MRILIEFNPDELMRGVETGTLQALFEATKLAERQVETAAQAVNKPILSENPIPAPTPVIQAPTAIPTAGPVTPTPAAPAATVPVAAQTYTMEQLAVAATQLIDAGQREKVVELLNSFGVQALTMLPQKQYGAFATQLRALGAKI
ncbi:hypothetical protein BR63_19050 [Thermanaerosceptrum fracticalcis]|uniref:Uncharacterized protein n=1 Tax=Thermanaerosceptrum fracticalcis TaxID=1712410 RepID=A0A7G6E7X7_THEFR|nr:hypothetical protein [Thermanaerosceptrum fracticalcis]QNB48181.1 hypothetical protein BR63_19050 [Thermanaerosceptrum fracticalcis]